MKPHRRLSVALGIVAVLGLVSLGCNTGVKVTQISPENGTVAGGEDVVIKGQGFKAGVQVKFCRAEAKSVILLGDNQIKATSPANQKGPCDITLTFDDGRAFKVANAFNYMEPGELMKRDMLGTKGTKTAPTKKKRVPPPRRSVGQRLRVEGRTANLRPSTLDLRLPSCT